MIKLHQVTQGSPQWQALRNKLYTGSNADKLLKDFGKTTINNGELSQYAAAEISDWSGNFYTKRAHRLEIEAIELYEAITGIKLIRLNGKKVGFVTNSKYPQCGYSPDDLAEDRVIEVKAFTEDKHREAAKDPSLKIKAQLQYGMFICEKKFADLLLYNPDLPAEEALFILTYRANPLAQANFKRILKELR